MANIHIKRQILEFIADHDVRWNYHPTKSELRKFFAGLSDHVDLHLEQLQREGLLEIGEGDEGTVSVPRLFPQIKKIDIRSATASLLGCSDEKSPAGSIALELVGAGIALDGDLSAHVVTDDSMVDAGIRPGDVAIFKIAHPQHREIVAVEISGQFVLRRYIIVTGIPHFLAENPVRPDLVPAFDQSIHGVLACLICADPSGLGRSLPSIRKVNYEKDGGLRSESMFVTMVQAEVRQSRKAVQKTAASAAKTRGAAKKNGKMTPPKKTVGADAWPKIPSGIALNDKRAAAFDPSQRRSVCDEQPDRPFGEEFLGALSRVSHMLGSACNESSAQKYDDARETSSANSAAKQQISQSTPYVDTSTGAGQAKETKPQPTARPESGAESQSRSKPRSFLRV